MYDYLAKVILIGQSGSGKSVLSTCKAMGLLLTSPKILSLTSNRQE